MKKPLSILSVAMLCPLASWAQLEPPNAAGVSLGHFHTIVRDVEATKKFWTVLGGKPIQIDGAEVMKFPGVFIFLTPGTPSAGSFGSVVNHVGFHVPNDQQSVKRWQLAGQRAEFAQSQFGVDYFGWAYTPDDLKIEINAEEYLMVPIASPHIHFWVPEESIPAMEDWYSKNFGGKPGPPQRVYPEGLRQEYRPGHKEAGNVLGIPALRLGIGSSDDPRARSPRSVGLIQGKLVTPDSPLIAGLTKPPLPTKGRTLDHIGFEVKNLEAFCKKLEASGVKFGAPYSKTRHKDFASAELTDPWGTSIELTEGLNKF